MLDRLQRQLLNFVDGSIWIAGTVLVKALAQIIILKSVTLFFGAAGIGYLGQVLSCITIVNTLFSVGLVNFIVVELASVKEGTESIQKLYGFIGIWCAGVLGILILSALIFSGNFSALAFNNREESLFFILLAIGFLFFNASSIAQGVYSARKAVKKLFFLNFFSVLTGLTLFLTVARLNQNYIPYAALIFYFVQGAVGLFFLSKSDENFRWFFRFRFDRTLLKKLLKFTLVMATTGALGALQQVYIRNYVITGLNLTWDDVGHWQALLKISEINLSFVGLTMLSLYLPSISASTSAVDVRNIATIYLKRVSIIVLFGCVFINFAAPYILQIIYSKDFVFLSRLLKIQLVGDLFKLSSWIFTYFILAKLKLSLFLSIELLGLGMLTLSSVLLSKIYLIDGLIYAQAVTSLMMLIVTYFIYNYYSRRDAQWSQ